MLPRDPIWTVNADGDIVCDPVAQQTNGKPVLFDPDGAFVASMQPRQHSLRFNVDGEVEAVVAAPQLDVPRVNADGEIEAIVAARTRRNVKRTVRRVVRRPGVGFDWTEGKHYRDPGTGEFAKQGKITPQRLAAILSPDAKLRESVRKDMRERLRGDHVGKLTEYARALRSGDRHKAQQLAAELRELTIGPRPGATGDERNAWDAANREMAKIVPLSTRGLNVPDGDVLPAPPPRATGSDGIPDNVGAVADRVRADYPGMHFDVSERDHSGGRYAVLSRIEVPEDQRGRGAGNDAMARLLDYADTRGVALFLSPSTDFGGNKRQLEDWYTAMGFRPNKGRRKDFRATETLVRDPQTVDVLPGPPPPDVPSAEDLWGDTPDVTPPVPVVEPPRTPDVPVEHVPVVQRIADDALAAHLPPQNRDDIPAWNKHVDTLDTLIDTLKAQTDPDAELWQVNRVIRDVRSRRDNARTARDKAVDRANLAARNNIPLTDIAPDFGDLAPAPYQLDLPADRLDRAVDIDHRLDRAGDQVRDDTYRRVTDTAETGAQRMAIRVPPNSLQSLGDDGRFVTVHESGRSRGGADPAARSRREHAQLGVPETVPDEQRPVYGFVDDQLGRESSAGYGSIVLHVNPEVAGRTTVTMGDSMQGDVIAAPLTALHGMGEADVLSTFADGFRNEYHELQFHGGLDTASLLPELDYEPPRYEHGRVDTTELKALDRFVADHPDLARKVTFRVPSGDHPDATLGGSVDRDRAETVMHETARLFAADHPDTEVLVAASFKEPDRLIPADTDILPAPPETDYRMAHRPSYGPPANNITSAEGEWSVPPDMLDHPEWYTGYSQPGFLPETVKQLEHAKGNPDASVTIYRAAPPGIDAIHDGDWVSLSRRYAEQHGYQFAADGSDDWPVLEMQVPASQVRFAGDDLMEWGYFPNGDPDETVLPAPPPLQNAPYPIGGLSVDEWWDDEDPAELEDFLASGWYNWEHRIADVQDAPEERMAVRVPRHKLDAILSDGRLKTQHESGTSGGANAPEIRRGEERVNWGVPDDVPDSERPIYGFLTDDDSQWGSRQYGDIVLKVKPEVAGRATVTLGDSLRSRPASMTVSQLRDAEARDLAAARGNGHSYLEVQYHGGLSLDDVDSIEWHLGTHPGNDSDVVAEALTESAEVADAHGKQLHVPLPDYLSDAGDWNDTFEAEYAELSTTVEGLRERGLNVTLQSPDYRPEEYPDLSQPLDADDVLPSPPPATRTITAIKEAGPGWILRDPNGDEWEVTRTGTRALRVKDGRGTSDRDGLVREWEVVSDEGLPERAPSDPIEGTVYIRGQKAEAPDAYDGGLVASGQSKSIVRFEDGDRSYALIQQAFSGDMDREKILDKIEMTVDTGKDGLWLIAGHNLRAALMESPESDRTFHRLTNYPEPESLKVGATLDFNEGLHFVTPDKPTNELAYGYGSDTGSNVEYIFDGAEHAYIIPYGYSAEEALIAGTYVITSVEETHWDNNTGEVERRVVHLSPASAEDVLPSPPPEGVHDAAKLMGEPFTAPPGRDPIIQMAWEDPDTFDPDFLDKLTRRIPRPEYDTMGPLEGDPVDTPVDARTLERIFGGMGSDYGGTILTSSGTRDAHRRAARLFPDRNLDVTAAEAAGPNDDPSWGPPYSFRRTVGQYFPDVTLDDITVEQYNATQRFLRSEGIGPDDELVFYRGIGEGQLREWERAGRPDEIGASALVSLSPNREMAEDYAQRRNGEVIEIRVKAEDVWSAAGAGVGYGDEWVVFGRDGRLSVVTDDDVLPAPPPDPRAPVEVEARSVKNPDGSYSFKYGDLEWDWTPWGDDETADGEHVNAQGKPVDEWGNTGRTAMAVSWKKWRGNWMMRHTSASLMGMAPPPTAGDSRVDDQTRRLVTTGKQDLVDGPFDVRQQMPVFDLQNNVEYSTRMLEAIADSPPGEPMYRGMVIPTIDAAHLDDIGPGDEFRMPLTAFSENPKIAGRFMKGKRGDTTVSVVLNNGRSYAAPTQTFNVAGIEVQNYDFEWERITAGGYRVTGVRRSKRKGRDHVDLTIEQVSTFDPATGEWTDVNTGEQVLAAPPSAEFDGIISQPMSTPDTVDSRIKDALSPGLREAADSYGITVETVDGQLTDHPEMAHLRGVTPRGWHADTTWDDVTGSYIGETRRAVAVRDALPGTVEHEFGHGMDRVLGGRTPLSSSPEFRALHRRVMENSPRLAPYIRDHPVEMFAELWSGATTEDRAGNLRRGQLSTIADLDETLGEFRDLIRTRVPDAFTEPVSEPVATQRHRYDSDTRQWVPDTTPPEVRQAVADKSRRQITEKLRDIPGHDRPEARYRQLDRVIRNATVGPLATDSVHDRLGPHGDGWTEERAVEQTELVNDLVTQIAAAGVPQDRDALVLGGLPGSGKSSWLRSDAAADLGVVTFEPGHDIPDGATHVSINPDLVKEAMLARGMSEDIDGLKPMEEAGFIHRESAMLARVLEHELTARGYNVVLDGTMVDADHTREQLTRLGINGYSKPRAVFADIDVGEASRSALNRYMRGADTAMGGRFVSSDVHRYARTEGPSTRNRAVFDSLVTAGVFREAVLIDNAGVADGRPRQAVLARYTDTDTSMTVDSLVLPAPPSKTGDPHVTFDLPDPTNPDIPGGWAKVGGQGGSNPGGRYRVTATAGMADGAILDGTEFYVKRAKSVDHASVEVATNLLYEAAGVPVPDVHIGTDGELVASRIVDGPIMSLSDGLADPQIASTVRSGMAVDAWLANWDVIGLGYDNIVISDGTPQRIDAGGGLTYRAQGTAKGDKFGPTVGELESLRDPNMNSKAGAVFGDITDDELRRGAEAVASVSPERIREIVASTGADDTIADTLIARRQDIINRVLNGEDPLDSPDPVDKPSLYVDVDPASITPKPDLSDPIEDVDGDTVKMWAESRGMVRARLASSLNFGGNEMLAGDIYEIQPYNDAMAHVWVPQDDGTHIKLAVTWTRFDGVGHVSTGGDRYSRPTTIRNIIEGETEPRRVRIGDNHLSKIGLHKGDHIDVTYGNTDLARHTFVDGDGITKTRSISWDRFDAIDNTLFADKQPVAPDVDPEAHVAEINAALKQANAAWLWDTDTPQQKVAVAETLIEQYTALQQATGTDMAGQVAYWQSQVDKYSNPDAGDPVAAVKAVLGDFVPEYGTVEYGAELAAISGLGQDVVAGDPILAWRYADLKLADQSSSSPLSLKPHARKAVRVAVTADFEQTLGTPIDDMPTSTVVFNFKELSDDNSLAIAAVTATLADWDIETMDGSVALAMLEDLHGPATDLWNNETHDGLRAAVLADTIVGRLETVETDDVNPFSYDGPQEWLLSSGWNDYIDNVTKMDEKTGRIAELDLLNALWSEAEGNGHTETQAWLEDRIGAISAAYAADFGEPYTFSPSHDIPQSVWDIHGKSHGSHGYSPSPGHNAPASDPAGVSAVEKTVKSGHDIGVGDQVAWDDMPGDWTTSGNDTHAISNGTVPYTVIDVVTAPSPVGGGDLTTFTMLDYNTGGTYKVSADQVDIQDSVAVIPNPATASTVTKASDLKPGDMLNVGGLDGNVWTPNTVTLASAIDNNTDLAGTVTGVETGTGYVSVHVTIPDGSKGELVSMTTTGEPSVTVHAPTPAIPDIPAAPTPTAPHLDKGPPSTYPSVANKTVMDLKDGDRFMFEDMPDGWDWSPADWGWPPEWQHLSPETVIHVEDPPKANSDGDVELRISTPAIDGAKTLVLDSAEYDDTLPFNADATPVLITPHGGALATELKEGDTFDLDDVPASWNFDVYGLPNGEYAVEGWNPAGDGGIHLDLIDYNRDGEVYTIKIEGDELAEGDWVTLSNAGPPPSPTTTSTDLPSPPGYPPHTPPVAKSVEQLDVGDQFNRNDIPASWGSTIDGLPAGVYEVADTTDAFDGSMYLGLTHTGTGEVYTVNIDPIALSRDEGGSALPNEAVPLFQPWVTAPTGSTPSKTAADLVPGDKFVLTTGPHAGQLVTVTGVDAEVTPGFVMVTTTDPGGGTPWVSAFDPVEQIDVTPAGSMPAVVNPDAKQVKAVDLQPGDVVNGSDMFGQWGAGFGPHEKLTVVSVDDPDGDGDVMVTVQSGEGNKYASLVKKHNGALDKPVTVLDGPSTYAEPAIPATPVLPADLQEGDVLRVAEVKGKWGGSQEESPFDVPDDTLMIVQQVAVAPNGNVIVDVTDPDGQWYSTMAMVNTGGPDKPVHVIDGPSTKQVADTSTAVATSEQVKAADLQPGDMVRAGDVADAWSMPDLETGDATLLTVRSAELDNDGDVKLAMKTANGIEYYGYAFKSGGAVDTLVAVTKPSPETVNTKQVNGADLKPGDVVDGVEVGKLWGSPAPLPPGKLTIIEVGSPDSDGDIKVKMVTENGGPAMAYLFTTWGTANKPVTVHDGPSVVTGTVETPDMPETPVVPLEYGSEYTGGELKAGLKFGAVDVENSWFPPTATNTPFKSHPPTGNLTITDIDAIDPDGDRWVKFVDDAGTQYSFYIPASRMSNAAFDVFSGNVDTPDADPLVPGVTFKAADIPLDAGWGSGSEVIVDWLKANPDADVTVSGVSVVQSGGMAIVIDNPGLLALPTKLGLNGTPDADKIDITPPAGDTHVATGPVQVLAANLQVGDVVASTEVNDMWGSEGFAGTGVNDGQMLTITKVHPPDVDGDVLVDTVDGSGIKHSAFVFASTGSVDKPVTVLDGPSVTNAPSRDTAGVQVKSGDLQPGDVVDMAEVNTKWHKQIPATGIAEIVDVGIDVDGDKLIKMVTPEGTSYSTFLPGTETMLNKPVGVLDGPSTLPPDPAADSVDIAGLPEGTVRVDGLEPGTVFDAASIDMDMWSNTDLVNDRISAAAGSYPVTVTDIHPSGATTYVGVSTVDGQHLVMAIQTDRMDKTTVHDPDATFRGMQTAAAGVMSSEAFQTVAGFNTPDPIVNAVEQFNRSHTEADQTAAVAVTTQALAAFGAGFVADNNDSKAEWLTAMKWANTQLERLRDTPTHESVARDIEQFDGMAEQLGPDPAATPGNLALLQQSHRLAKQLGDAHIALGDPDTAAGWRQRADRLQLTVSTATALQTSGARHSRAVMPDPPTPGEPDLWGEPPVAGGGFRDAMTEVAANPRFGSVFLYGGDDLDGSNVRVRALSATDGGEQFDVHQLKFTASQSGQTALREFMADGQRTGQAWLHRETEDGVMDLIPGAGMSGGVTYQKDVTLNDGRRATVTFRQRDENKDINSQLWALDGTVEVVVRDNGDRLTQQNMESLFSQLGLQTSYPTPTEMRGQAQRALVELFRDPDVDQGPDPDNPSPEAVQAALHLAANGFNVTPDNVTWERVGNQIIPLMPEASAARIAEQAHMVDGGAFINTTGASPEAMVDRMLGEGMVATTTRWSEGLVGTGTYNTPGRDMQTGGAPNVFLRQTRSLSSTRRESTIVFRGTPLLRRLDWFAYTSDNFGNQQPHSRKRRNNLQNLREHDGSRETMFRRSVPIQYWNHLIMSNYNRDQILRLLRERGITHINGIPINEFVLASSDVDDDNIPDGDGTGFTIGDIPDVTGGGF